MSIEVSLVVLLRHINHRRDGHGIILVTAIIEESLRARLARTSTEPRTRVRLTTTGHGGLRPGIDLDDSASLLDVMDGVE